MNNFLEHGQVIYMTSGAYSDYSIDGFYRVLRSFKPDEVKAEFASLGGWPKQTLDWRGIPHNTWYGAAHAFTAWLVAELYLESCGDEFQEVWCDDSYNGLSFQVQ